MRYFLLYVTLFALAACKQPNKERDLAFLPEKDSILSCTTSFRAYTDTIAAEEIVEVNVKGDIDTRDVKPEAVVSFAQTLKGVPYKYASTDPAKGFDCSGFITYVFNHFKISVPRSSVDFTHVGKEVPAATAKPGDLILFTGTDSTVRVVGHMGIVTTNTGNNMEFIHSTSGKAYGVTTTPLSDYYMTRFVKVIRIFED